MSEATIAHAGQGEALSGVDASDTTTVDGAALLAGIQQRAELLESDVLADNVVSSEAVQAWRPGGVENPDSGPFGWLSYLTQLHRWHERAVKGGTSGGVHSHVMRRVVRAANADEPIYLTLSDGSRVAVFPKGERALWRITCTTVVLRWATQHVLALTAYLGRGTTDADDAAALAALQHGTELVSRLQRELAWILTYPGPTLPWTEDGVWDHTPPDKFDTWQTEDFVALQNAHVRIHLVRLRMLQERVAHLANGDDGALQLEQFMGVMASDLHTSGAELAENFAMGNLFAMAILKWESIETARKKEQEPSHGLE